MSGYLNVAILTMSEKHGNKCVAAYDIFERKLVRLVANSNGDGIPERYLKDISILDLVTVRIVEKAPMEHQCENVVIDLTCKISRWGIRAQINSIYENLPKSNTVFGNNSYKLSTIQTNNSLEMVRFNDMSINLHENTYGHKKTKATFTIGNIKHYNYSITDSRYFDKEMSISSGYAVISLPPTNNFTSEIGYYKFIASIIPD